MTTQEPPERPRRMRWVAPAARWLLALVAVASLAALAVEGAALVREAREQTCTARAAADADIWSAISDRMKYEKAVAVTVDALAAREHCHE